MLERPAIGHSKGDSLLREMHHFAVKNTPERSEEIIRSGILELANLAQIQVDSNLTKNIALALIDRTEIGSRPINLPSSDGQNVWNVFAQTHDMVFGQPIINVDSVPRTILAEGIKELAQESAEHVRLLGSPSVEIPITRNLNILIGYSGANWEGLGGVYIYLRDSSSDEYIPAFVIRGNPGLSDTGQRYFAIRAIQPWVSEIDPSISDLTRLAERRKDDVIQIRGLDVAESDSEYENAQRVLDFVGTRKTIVAKLSRQLKLRTQDQTEIFTFMLAFAMGYLHNQGIDQFRGIAHGEHPEVKAWENELEFNYDDFWRQRQFQPTSPDYLHPWMRDYQFGENVKFEDLGLALKREETRFALEDLQSIS